MFLPAIFTGLDVLMTKCASISSLGWLTYEAGFICNMLVVNTLMDTFIASWTLLEFFMFVAFFQKMIVVGFNFYDLTAMFAFSKHQAIFPEMHI
jgi:hypothetical protein